MTIFFLKVGLEQSNTGCLISVLVFLKGIKMSENQYIDKKIRQLHDHKASPFDLQPLEWILNAASNMSKLKFEIVHFLVILVLLLLNIGGCGGQPTRPKF